MVAFQPPRHSQTIPDGQKLFILRDADFWSPDSSTTVTNLFLQYIMPFRERQASPGYQRPERTRRTGASLSSCFSHNWEGFLGQVLLSNQWHTALIQRGHHIQEEYVMMLSIGHRHSPSLLFATKQCCRGLCFPASSQTIFT